MDTAKIWLQWIVDNHVLIGAAATVAAGIIVKLWLSLHDAREGLSHTTAAIEAGPRADYRTTETIKNTMDLKPETVSLLMNLFTAAVKKRVANNLDNGSSGAAKEVNRAVDLVDTAKIH